jgi:uncharacterized protein YndB with AHSA1/START domain
MDMEIVRPTAKVSMLIHRPAQVIYDAFTNPEALTRFWLSAASGPLALGTRVRWDFMVPGAHVFTEAKQLEPHRRIFVEWSDGTTVQWELEPWPDDATVVTLENAGFSGDANEAVEAALEATQGFTIVLCDLKALLETNASANLVRDKARLIGSK